MKLLYLFIFICLSQNVWSQKKNVSIKFCPFALVDDISFPTVQAGVEFRLSKRLSWYNEFGIRYRKSFMEADTDSSFVKTDGFKIKSEIRYYLQNARPGGSYVAANAFFTKDHHNTQIDYYYQKDSAQLSHDAFGVEKKVFGINLVYGYQKALSKRFSLDAYWGLGIRFRNISSVNKEYNKYRDSFDFPTDINIPASKDNIEARGGRTAALNFTLGLRLSFNL